MIVEGSFNTVLFTCFVQGLLDKVQPFPRPRSVIVMGNCAMRKGPEIRELIEATNVPRFYFSPIELALSCSSMLFAGIFLRLKELNSLIMGIF